MGQRFFSDSDNFSLLPAIARLFGVNLETLFGQADEENRKAIRRKIHSVAEMNESDREDLLSLIRLCRREKENGQKTRVETLFPQSDWECLTTADFARWGWLNQIRQDERFMKLADRIKALLE